MLPLRAAILLLFVPAVFAQIDGKAAYTAFTAWKSAPENRSLKWEEAIAKTGRGGEDDLNHRVPR